MNTVLGTLVLYKFMSSSDNYPSDSAYGITTISSANPIQSFRASFRVMKKSLATICYAFKNHEIFVKDYNFYYLNSDDGCEN